MFLHKVPAQIRVKLKTKNVGRQLVVNETMLRAALRGLNAPKHQTSVCFSQSVFGFTFTADKTHFMDSETFKQQRAEAIRPSVKNSAGCHLRPQDRPTTSK